MKQVKVRFFAAFREAAGVETVNTQSATGTVGELFAELAQTYTGLQHESASLVAVNDQMVSWDSPFEQHDEVLFFPPVAGG